MTGTTAPGAFPGGQRTRTGSSSFSRSREPQPSCRNGHRTSDHSPSCCWRSFSNAWRQPQSRSSVCLRSPSRWRFASTHSGMPKTERSGYASSLRLLASYRCLRWPIGSTSCISGMGCPYGGASPAGAWQRFNSGFSLPLRILCLSGLFLSLFLPRARWLALPLFVGAWIWVDRVSYDLRNSMGLVLIAAVIPVDALARRFIKGDAGAFGRKWMLGDTTVAACALVAWRWLHCRWRRQTSNWRRNSRPSSFGSAPARPSMRRWRGICVRDDLFTTTKYPYTVASFQPYRSQLHYLLYTLPIGDDTSANAGVRKYGMDQQRDFENAQGCRPLFSPPRCSTRWRGRFFRTIFSGTTSRRWLKRMEWSFGPIGRAASRGAARSR